MAAPLLLFALVSASAAAHCGQLATTSLLTDAKTHARQIAEVTQRRIMPPWLPEPGELPFVEDLWLSDEQVGRMQAWVHQGALEGDRADPPAKPQFVEG